VVDAWPLWHPPAFFRTLLEIGEFSELLSARSFEGRDPGCVVYFCAIVPFGKQRIC